MGIRWLEMLDGFLVNILLKSKGGKMDILPIIVQFVQSYVLPPVGVAVAGVLGAWAVQWQARAKVAAARSNLMIMHTNADKATKAIEQLFPNDPPEVKKQKALALAQQWNQIASVNVSDSSQTLANEAAVFNLPTDTSTPVPQGATTDEAIPKSGLAQGQG